MSSRRGSPKGSFPGGYSDQMRAVSSVLAVASWRSAGLNATQLTAPVWPSRVRVHLPVADSQMRTVVSELAVAISLPSGL